GEEQRGTVRTLLRLEIEENARVISQILDPALRAEGALSYINNRPDPVLGCAKTLAELPDPAWTWLAWESQLSNVTMALSPSEVALAHDFYAGLKRLDTIRSRLQELCTDLYGDHSRFLVNSHERYLEVGWHMRH